MPPEKVRPFLHFTVEPELIKRLDDFRFKNRFESRAACIKWLLKWALDAKPRPEHMQDSKLQ